MLTKMLAVYFDQSISNKENHDIAANYLNKLLTRQNPVAVFCEEPVLMDKIRKYALRGIIIVDVSLGAISKKAKYTGAGSGFESFMRDERVPVMTFYGKPCSKISTNYLYILYSILQTHMCRLRITRLFYGLATVTRSLSLVLVEHLCKKFEIEFYYFSRKPFRGRVSAFNNTRFLLSEFNGLYQDILNEIKSGCNIANIAHYLDSYREFKENVDQPALIRKAHKKSSRPSASWVGFIKNVACFFETIKKIPYADDAIMKMPFILCVLSKPNSWVQNLAYGRYDITKAIERVLISIPPEYSLVIKDVQNIRTPHLSRKELYSLSRKWKRIYFTTDQQTQKLYKKCSAVFTLCSTAGIESMMYDKPLILYGESPPFTGLSNAPMQCALKEEEMREAVKISLKKGISKDKVYAYFKLLLTISRNFDGTKDNNRFIRLRRQTDFSQGLSSVVRDRECPR